MNNNELMHYGVLGMKWGVRRYRNKDGTLTSKGKERNNYKNLKSTGSKNGRVLMDYSKDVVNKNLKSTGSKNGRVLMDYSKDVVNKNLKSTGSKGINIETMNREELMKLLDSGRDFVIQKGSEAYRSTTNNKEKLLGKKYVSLKKDDIGIYNNFVYETYGSNNVYDDTYTTNKNLSVAGKRIQSEILQEIYGKKIGEIGSQYVAKGWINEHVMNKKISDMTDDEFGSYAYYNPFDHDRDILNKPMSNPDTKKFIDELSKKGYDAAVDMVDTSIGYSEAPIIILKSEDSLKKKSQEKVDWQK